MQVKRYSRFRRQYFRRVLCAGFLIKSREVYSDQICSGELICFSHNRLDCLAFSAKAFLTSNDSKTQSANSLLFLTKKFYDTGFPFPALNCCNFSLFGHVSILNKYVIDSSSLLLSYFRGL